MKRRGEEHPRRTTIAVDGLVPFIVGYFLSKVWIGLALLYQNLSSGLLSSPRRVQDLSHGWTEFDCRIRWPTSET